MSPSRTTDAGGLGSGLVPEVIRLLLVEDDPIDAELVLDRLRDDGLAIEPLVVADRAGYECALREFRPDIVLSDLSLPGFSGDLALRLLRERDQRTPFLYVSGTIGERAAIEALRGGATDYILKDSMARLASAVRRALHEAAERRARDAAEDELVRSQRFETLAILASSLGHDLRNILQPVVMAAQLIQNKNADPDVTRMCDMIRDCCDQGLELVSAMMALARGGEGVSANRIRLAALLEAVGLLLRPTLADGVELSIEQPDPTLEIPGNATEFQQCLLNLALNGAQAMPEGGRLNVSAQAIRLAPDFFEEGEQRVGIDYAQITVSDTGMGMSAETLGRLFTPFFTTKENGNGLGLVSCRRFVERHRGLIRVHSEPGEGTRFDLYLPVASADTEAASDAADLGHGHGETILVLCDVGPTCKQILDILDGRGYAPILASNDYEAIRRLGESSDIRIAIIDAGFGESGPAVTLEAMRRSGFDGATLLLVQDGVDSDCLAVDTRLAGPLDEATLLASVAELI